MKANTINLPGVLNARELGGYPAGNRTVRSGVLIRSGVLNKAEPGAIDILSTEYRVQTVVDFRMSGVRDGAPDKEIPGAGYIRLPVVEMEDYLSMVKSCSSSVKGERKRMRSFSGYCSEQIPAEARSSGTALTAKTGQVLPRCFCLVY